MAENEAIKFDDEIKALIIEALDENKTGGGDIDALFKTENGFVIVEFLRCLTVRPFESHPNRYWNYGTEKTGNKNKFLALWNIAQKTGSKLILVNYEDSREQFKIIEVRGLSDSQKIYDEISTKMNFEQFKTWFKILAGNAEK
jgi:hypothetical protein